mmetsp:Transcript_84005/g.166843  ORF Transcript_84005/g.166843 Transcript_84005/m.166843 type:complete len:383 (+) Transcript_84005:289-1437(+)
MSVWFELPSASSKGAVGSSSAQALHNPAAASIDALDSLRSGQQWMSSVVWSIMVPMAVHGSWVTVAVSIALVLRRCFRARTAVSMVSNVGPTGTAEVAACSSDTAVPGCGAGGMRRFANHPEQTEMKKSAPLSMPASLNMCQSRTARSASASARCCGGTAAASVSRCSMLRRRSGDRSDSARSNRASSLGAPRWASSAGIQRSMRSASSKPSSGSAAKAATRGLSEQESQMLRNAGAPSATGSHLASFESNALSTNCRATRNTKLSEQCSHKESNTRTSRPSSLGSPASVVSKTCFSNRDSSGANSAKRRARMSTWSWSSSAWMLLHGPVTSAKLAWGRAPFALLSTVAFRLLDAAFVRPFRRVLSNRTSRGGNTGRMSVRP